MDECNIGHRHEPPDACDSIEPRRQPPFLNRGFAALLAFVLCLGWLSILMGPGGLLGQTSWSPRTKDALILISLGAFMFVPIIVTFAFDPRRSSNKATRAAVVFELCMLVGLIWLYTLIRGRLLAELPLPGVIKRVLFYGSIVGTILAATGLAWISMYIPDGSDASAPD